MRSLTSDDYIEVARVLAQRIVGLMDAAPIAGLIPPFELHITGADDDIVVHASVARDGRLHDLAGYSQQLLSARFPLTATLSDSKGHVLEIHIPENEMIQ